MTLYRCTSISAEGRNDLREIDAPDERHAVLALRAEGLTPLTIRPGAPNLIERLNQPVQLGNRMRLADQSLLLSQLAILVQSGLPVDRSLDLLREQAPRAALGSMIGRILAGVRAGNGLAAGLGGISGMPAYVTGVARAAERGGHLGEALASLAARLSLAASTRRQLLTALTYPAAVLSATVLALALVLTTVVPQFEPIFEGEEARLPDR